MPRKKQNKYTPLQLEEKVAAYFEMCKCTPVESAKPMQQYAKPPTMEGLAAYLDLSKSTLMRYMAGKYEGDSAQRQAVADCVERARDYITAETLEGALLGRYDARICTMILNGMGYGGAEQEEQLHTLTVEWKGISAEEVRKWAE